MEILFSEKLPDKEEFFELFLTTGWNEKYHADSEILFQAIQNSWYFISAYINDKLVGFGRIISDGILHSLILDLIVHPDFQGKKIGKEILEKLKNKLLENNIKDIQLFSAKGKAGFYKKYSFVERPTDAPGMELKVID